jgi:phosphonate transport system ATP-binding protein
VVFDGKPGDLTDATARELYGLEAGEVMDTAGTAMPEPAQEVRPALTVVAGRHAG